MLCFVVSVLPGSCTVAGILVILDSCSASLFLGSRFVVDMILYLVVVATFHQISDFFLGISFFFFQVPAMAAKQPRTPEERYIKFCKGKRPRKHYGSLCLAS